MHTFTTPGVFFEEEMRDIKNRKAVKRKAEDPHSRLEDPLFTLYLFFYSQVLMISIASLKRQPVIYCKIRAFKNTSYGTSS